MEMSTITFIVVIWYLSNKVVNKIANERTNAKIVSVMYHMYICFEVLKYIESYSGIW